MKAQRQGTPIMSFPAADLFQKCSPPCSKERSGVRLVLKPAYQVVKKQNNPSHASNSDFYNLLLLERVVSASAVFTADPLNEKQSL